MARVGILSMQRIINYGSFLQAYALRSMLEEIGHEVQFVDYRVGKPLINTRKNQKVGFFGKIYKIIEAFCYDAPINHKIKFILYKKQFSKKYNGFLGLTIKPNYTPALDVLVIGSDEVFNCVQQNPNVGYSIELFGSSNNAKKLITYAASFGNTTMKKLKQYGKKEEIGELLKQFDAISVRDKNSAKIVSQLSGKKVEYHLDPVLVYSLMEKCKLIPRISLNEKYLILYAYSGRVSNEESNWIIRYATKKKLKVYAIGGVQKCADEFINCSPFEVLAYFQNAEEIITDTFHGTIFSIIAKRPFITIVRKSIGTSYGNEEKLKDLLERLGLENRISYSINNVDSLMREMIDYNKVGLVLQKEQKRSYDYIVKQTTV